MKKTNWILNYLYEASLAVLICTQITTMERNSVKKFRENLLLSKAELARKAGLSPLTIDRIEKGKGCRPETKRKVLLALGLKLSDKDRIFNP